MLGEPRTQAWLRGTVPSTAAFLPPAVLLVPPDPEEDGRLQMNRIRAQLVGAFREQKEMRSSLLELENASTELHMDMSRHLLTIAE